MNQVKLSAIRDIPRGTDEFATVKALCRLGRDTMQNETFTKGSWTLFRKMILKVKKMLPMIQSIWD